MNATLPEYEMVRGTRVWIPVASEWIIKSGWKREYQVNTDPWLHGIAIELLGNVPINVPINVLGSHTEYHGSDHHPSDVQVMSVIPVDHLDPRQPPSSEKPLELALQPGLVIANGDPVVAVETEYGAARRYLILSGGQLRWQWAYGLNVIERSAP